MEASFKNQAINFSGTSLCVCKLLQILFLHVLYLVYSLSAGGNQTQEQRQKKKQLFVSSSAESVGATSRCPFNTCDVFSSFQVLCRVRCSSPLAMAHIFQTTVPLQDTIPKCPIKLLLHIWIISTEPVTTLVTIQHQHKML